MTKEEIINGAIKRLIIRTPTKDVIEDAMDEYAKQQAVEFDIWKRQNAYTIGESGDHYLKLVITDDGKKAHTKIFTIEYVYDQFIESQNK